MTQTLERRGHRARRVTTWLAAVLGSLSCGAEPTMLATWPGAVARARAARALLVVHFRLPGRPLSDAMDAALVPSQLTALEGLVHVRLDAELDRRLFQRLIGGSGRRGPGLATCIVDPTAADTALAVHTGYLTEPGLQQLVAEVAALRAAMRPFADASTDGRASTADQRHSLALADHFARCGRRDLARARLTASFAGSVEPERARWAARLARLAAEDGDLVNARAWLPHCDDGAHARLTRAIVHLHAREPQAALTLLRHLSARADLGDDAASALLHLGRAYHETGADAAALDAYAQLAVEFAGTEHAAHAAREAAHVRDGDQGHSHAALPP